MLFPKEADKQEGFFRMKRPIWSLGVVCKVLSLFIFLSKSRQTNLLLGWVYLSVVIVTAQANVELETLRALPVDDGLWHDPTEEFELSGSTFWTSPLPPSHWPLVSTSFSLLCLSLLGALKSRIQMWWWLFGCDLCGCDLFGLEWNYRCLCSLEDQTCMKLSRVKVLLWRTVLRASSFIDVQFWMYILGEYFSEYETC